MFRFLIYLLILTLLLSVSVYTAERSGFFEVPSYAAFILSYMALTTGIIFYVVQRKTEPFLFTQTYLLSIVLKLFAGCAFILTLILMDIEEASGNAALFILSYLLFTFLEVFCLQKKTKAQNP